MIVIDLHFIQLLREYLENGRLTSPDDSKDVEAIAELFQAAFKAPTRRNPEADSPWVSKTAEFNFKSKHGGLRDLQQRLGVVAKSGSNVLVIGESGTGKELLARTIHLKSNVGDGPFVAVNCAAIPESLFEAEFFGVAKGAATGTIARKGKFEMADGGTLFLDEIGELSLMHQAKLLRVIQEKVVTRVGSTVGEVPVKFRLICATNRNLEEMVRNSTFRPDLYYRLNVAALTLPPLRDRRDDLPQLCLNLMRDICKEHGWRERPFSKESIEALAVYDWPGNIRELANKIENALLLNPSETALQPKDFGLAPNPQTVGNVYHLPTARKNTQEALNLKSAKDQLERELIERALSASEGNKSQAARLLGITREGLRKAMKR